MRTTRRSHTSEFLSASFEETAALYLRLSAGEPFSLCLQFHRRRDKNPKPPQRCDSHHGSGGGGVQGDLRHGPGGQPERPVLSGSFLHEQDIHPDAAQPAQWEHFLFSPFNQGGGFIQLS